MSICFEIRTQGGIFLAFVEQHFKPPRHNRQRIVELVHEARCELAEKRELVAQPRLPVRGLQFLAQASRAVTDRVQLQSSAVPHPLRPLPQRQSSRAVAGP